jgi:DNA-binding Lrp family transcriptional regulator
LNFTAFVAIRNDGGIHCRDVAPRLRAMPQVEELHSVAGDTTSWPRSAPRTRGRWKT